MTTITHDSVTARTAAAVERHTQALSQGNFDALAANFAEDARLFTPQETIHGRDAICEFFKQGLQGLPADYMHAFEMIHSHIAGEIAYLVYKAEPYVTIATDTWVVQNDQIVAQTFTAVGPLYQHFT